MSQTALPFVQTCCRAVRCSMTKERSPDQARISSESKSQNESCITFRFRKGVQLIFSWKIQYFFCEQNNGQPSYFDFEYVDFSKRKRFSKNIFIRYEHKVSFDRTVNGKILKEKWILPAGSEIESVQIIARGSNIKNIQKLINENQFPDGSFSTPDDWQKIKGYALIYSPDRKRKLYTEIHFYLIIHAVTFFDFHHQPSPSS